MQHRIEKTTRGPETKVKLEGFQAYRL